MTCVLQSGGTCVVMWDTKNSSQLLRTYFVPSILPSSPHGLISFNRHYVIIFWPHVGDHPPAPPLPGLVAGPVDGKITEPCGHTIPASATASGAPAHSTPGRRDHCTCISTRLSGPMETLAFPVAAKKEPQQGSSKLLTPGINSDR